MAYLVLKYLHIIGATVLFGTGAGIAFFMLMAHRTGNVGTVAAVAHIVVIADFMFTATAVLSNLLRASHWPGMQAMHSARDGSCFPSFCTL